MKNFLLGVTIGLSLLASGCISPTETVNAPAIQNMTKEVASSVVFSPFIQRYAKHLEAISGETIHPLIQVGHLKNKTKDPSFQMDLIADVFCTELLESGRFEISVAAGSAGRLFPFAESLVNKSLRKNGTLEIPDLSLEGYLISCVQVNYPERKKGLVLCLQLVDLHSGKLVWSSIRSISFQDSFLP